MSIQLDYDTCKHIAMDFLRQCRSDLQLDQDEILHEASQKTLHAVQLEDYADNRQALHDIARVLKYLGDDSESLSK